MRKKLYRDYNAFIVRISDFIPSLLSNNYKCITIMGTVVLSQAASVITLASPGVSLWQPSRTTKSQQHS